MHAHVSVGVGRLQEARSFSGSVSSIVRPPGRWAGERWAVGRATLAAVIQQVAVSPASRQSYRAASCLRPIVPVAFANTVAETSRCWVLHIEIVCRGFVPANRYHEHEQQPVRLRPAASSSRNKLQRRQQRQGQHAVSRGNKQLVGTTSSKQGQHTVSKGKQAVSRDNMQ